VLRASVERLRAVGHALAWAGSCLEEIRSALPVLEATMRSIRAPQAELASSRQLCVKVFGKHKDCGAACFTEVASCVGVLDFLRFGRAAVDAKKDPIKLLQLLEVFDSLNKLRFDFNRLFGVKACAEIQTRDLVKLLVNGAAEIFEELIVHH
jgi:hypothetical protein